MDLPREKKFGLAHAVLWMGLLLAAPTFAGELSTSEAHGVPLVGPLTQNVPSDIGIRRFTFYLLSGTEVQGRAPVEFAISRLPDPSIGAAVVHPAQPDTQAVARAMAKQSVDRGWGWLRVVEYPAGDTDPGVLAGELKDSGVQIVFFLGFGAEFQMLATTADRIGWRPFMFLQGHLAETLTPL
jgi:ABC-type branched-subunit amino acid transport system substrate-binding protein